MSFKVGDIVMVTSDAADFDAIHYRGRVGSVVCASAESSIVEFRDIDDQWIFRNEYLLLFEEEPRRSMTLKEAIDKCLNGAKVYNEQWVNQNAYICFDGGMFNYVRGDLKDSWTGSRLSTGWRDFVEQPPKPPSPRYTKGDFVITSTGKLGLVLDVLNEVDRSIRYKVRFDFRVIAEEPEFTVEEDTITKVVDEMLEPKGVN